MRTITIPQKLIQHDDLIVLPRKEYEALLAQRRIEEFRPTTTQKKALRKAENNLRQGKTLSYDAVARKLGFKN
jgi:hypothetical protein